MDFEQVIRQELKKPLPGKEYQQKLAPFNRTDIKFESSEIIEAGVAIVILAHDNIHSLILMKRPEYEGHHSGQVSFPGGKFESTDNSLLDTAIRETNEEIGIQLEEDEFLGELTPLYIEVSGFKVVPYIFYVQRQIEFILEEKEVDYLIFPDLKTILNDSTIKRIQFNIRDYNIDTPYFDLENEIVWGATSMILGEFTEVLKRLLNKNPGLL